MSLRWLLTSLFLVLPGCGSALRATAPEVPLGRYRIAADDITVCVSDEPLGLTVVNANGDPVLASTDALDGSGFGALGWTSGEVTYQPRISPGYTEIQQHLAPYRDAYDVSDARVTADRVSLQLTPRHGDEPPVAVSYAVSRGTLRVSAELAGKTPRAWSTGFLLPSSEEFLGFGERFNRLGQRGRVVFSWAEEGGVGLGEQYEAGPNNPWPSGETMTSYPVPFFVSTRGYGFWLDTPYYSEFDLGHGRTDAWRVSHVGPRLQFEVYVPSAKDSRPWTEQLVDRFTERTGRPMLPPPWAFGPRRRVTRGSMEQDVPEIQAMRDADLAITSVDDAVHFYPHGAHRGREEVLRQWIGDAGRLGYRVNAYYNSFVQRGIEGPFAALSSGPDPRAYFLHRADGSLPNLWILTGGRIAGVDLIDLTQPEARRIYQASFGWARDLGYSGWMYDFGEYVPSDVVASDGTSGEALHNMYPVQYAETLYHAMQASPLKDDWLAFMRSGYTGSSHFVPMAWSGDPAASFEDADGLPSMLRAGINLGLSGVPFWGSDIGGYHCVADGARAADEELLVRWVQQGALTPSMHDQNACVGAPKSRKATLWRSHAALLAWRRYARLHTRLFPYLYAWAAHAQRSGAPLMRSLFFEHPERPDLVTVDDAYYLGPALFVAPVVKRGERSKHVVLPDAYYLDWETRALVHGGEGTLDAPLEKLPLLLRAGQLVPMLDASIDTLAEEDNPDVVGPTDVASRYDVVALLAPSTPSAKLVLHDGAELSASWVGSPAPTIAAASADCPPSSDVQRRADGTVRVQAVARGDTAAGQLQLHSTSDRCISWDIVIRTRD